MSTTTTRVLLVPAHPSEGFASMDRYWRELVTANRQKTASGDLPTVQITSALDEPPLVTARASKNTRFLQKYLLYPLRIKRMTHFVDVVHILDHSFAPLLRQVPRHVRKIVTVHDLAPLRDPGSLTPGQIRRFRKASETLHLADLLLADSSHTRNDIIDLLKIPAEKIHVLPLGVNVDYFSEKRERPSWWPSTLSGLPRVIVSVGSTLPRKNLQILPAVFAALRAKISGPLYLVRVGQKLPADLSADLSQILGREGVIERGHASEDELAAIYQHADALIFPSLYEGFGLPLLEAMAAGCPVVSSNTSSLPEVGGTAALYFEPDDSETAAACLAQILADSSIANSLVRLSHERAKSFSWAVHLEKLLLSYKQRSNSLVSES